MVERPKVYIHLYDKWGNSVGAIELEPRVVEGLPERGTRKGELIFNTLDSAIYYWDGSAWRTFGIGPHTHVRADITDFWAAPFWDNIPDKPSTFPPESHTHGRSDITDFFNAPFWDNIPDKPSVFPPEAHTHPRSDITDFFSSPFWDNIPDKPSTFPPEAHTHTISEITDIANASVNYANSAGNADTVDGEHASAFTHARNGGKNIWVQSTEPTGLEVGDIWIQI